MPILQNAKKALRSSRKKTVFNSRVKSILKTTIDKIKKDPTKDNLSSAFSSIDKTVKRNLMHKNKAGRIKAQLSKLVKTSDTPEPKKKIVVKKVTKVTKAASPKAKVKRVAKKKTAAKATKKTVKK